MADQIPKSAGEIYEFGSFRVDASERQLFRGSQEIPVTRKAFDTRVARREMVPVHRRSAA